jgi:hypothetical protein
MIQASPLWSVAAADWAEFLEPTITLSVHVFCHF